MNDKWTADCGVVVGKFNPPHIGHLHLITRGAASVKRLYVMLCDRPDQTIPATTRKAWLEDVTPDNVTVLITPDDLPLENQPWAERALAVLPEPPQLAFTSEEWGDEWAEMMGAKHVMVDQERTLVPISATKLRTGLREHFEFLVPAAKADLAQRVVLIGAESTGKTSMAEALAQTLGTVWVPEHGRWYWEGRRFLADQSWSVDEFLRISVAQQALEKDLARKAHHGLVICDTDAMVTAVWCERYLGGSSTRLDTLASNPVPELYLACSPDFEWVQDGTRESEAHRDRMHELMLGRALESGAPVIRLGGSHQQRLETALTAIKENCIFNPLV